MPGKAEQGISICLRCQNIRPVIKKGGSYKLMSQRSRFAMAVCCGESSSGSSCSAPLSADEWTNNQTKKGTKVEWLAGIHVRILSILGWFYQSGKRGSTIVLHPAQMHRVSALAKHEAICTQSIGTPITWGNLRMPSTQAFHRYQNESIQRQPECSSSPRCSSILGPIKSPF